MTKSADLHIHTYFSDGTSSPAEVIQEAQKQDLSCIAITDHDAIDGFSPTLQLAKDVGIEVLSGIELSTEIHGKDVHILAYCFDPHDQTLLDHLKKFQEGRVSRMKGMLEKLRIFGITDISWEDVARRTQSQSVGRLHLAMALVDKGWVVSTKEAFAKYLGEGSPTYVPKYKLSPYEAIEFVKSVGGVTVLAHPALTNKDELIPSLVEAGLGGIEVYYPNTSNAAIDYYRGLAKKHGLAMTGGSDAHGKNRNHTYVGKVRIPYELVEELKNRI